MSGQKGHGLGRWILWACIASSLLPAVACDRLPQNEHRPAVAPGTPPPPRVREGAQLLYTFFDRRARMRTVDRLADVELESRRAVMVTDPRHPMPDEQVYVTDLNVKSDVDGSHPVWIEQRGHWLDRVMPRISVANYPARPSRAEPAAKQPKRVAALTRKRRRRRRAAAKPPVSQPAAAQQPNTPPTTAAPPPVTAAPAPAAPQAPLPKVIMFSTTWCPSCRHARQFLTQRGVRYVDLDVEKHPEAAKRMVAIQQANGFRPGAVPLIIVNGRAFQGFSRLQLEVAINNLEGGSS